ncbi:MAG: hypothetical protein JW795_15100 [Chitinivibrionales bacterium]|nr:hypothetical protein [Chitinivibrionales bacterium]
MKTFGGPVLFLNRSDINTDEIIAAKYLTEIEKNNLKPHLLEDLILEGFDHVQAVAGVNRVIVTRDNFGCGSSREHAVWVLEAHEIHTVIASGFSRIFRQNMFNCGMLALQLKPHEIDEIFQFNSKHVEKSITCTVNLELKNLTFSAIVPHTTMTQQHQYVFHLSPFEEALIGAGGWVEYADKHY